VRTWQQQEGNFHKDNKNQPQQTFKIQHVTTSYLQENEFKGLVHPKMKIKSLITHPHAVPTP